MSKNFLFPRICCTFAKGKQPKGTVEGITNDNNQGIRHGRNL